MLDADDNRLQCCHGHECVLAVVIECAHAIQADADAHHLHLPLGEAHNAGRVQDVARQSREVTAQQRGTLVETVKLAAGVLVLVGHIGHTEVRENRCRSHYVLTLEQLDDGWQLVERESQPVHASVHLDVHRQRRTGAVARPLLDELAAHLQAVDLGLEAQREERLIVDDHRVEHDDGHGDASLAQLHTLVLHSHSQIVGPAVLQRLGHLVRACAISSGLDHGDGECGGLDQ